MPSAVATAKRHTGAGGQCLEEHVTRADSGTTSTGRGMKPRLDKTSGSLYATRDSLAELSFSAKCDECRRGIGTITLFQRRLQRAQLFRIHSL